ncbi:MAG: glycosyltransferase family 2 protein [Vicinamibacterales bacterium]
MTTSRPGLSIVVPAFNNAVQLQACLQALPAASTAPHEILVVDDGSTQEIRDIAEHNGAAYLRLDSNSGPSSARNAGARRAAGDVLVFIDSDVVVAPGGIDRLVGALDADRDVAAVFGSYDDNPSAPGILSQYRNLLHHYMHQTASPEASTFWAGLGAVRRPVFEAIGGFDERRFSRCMEDIELGYRLRQSGYRIRLEKTAQGTHLKRWTLRSVIRTDVHCRAIPWSQLLIEGKGQTGDLNVKRGQRISVALTGLAGVALALAVVQPSALAAAAAALAGVLVLNRDLYAYLVRERGVIFTCAAIPFHLLYFVYSGLAYAWVWGTHRLTGLASALTGLKDTRF